MVIRLKAPTEGETVVEDAVQGRVVWQNKDLDDLVLLRSDGTPTYMLAVVVDDHDMGITHVIRGDDHLTNAARQTQIYQALGWDVPSMSHIPLIHGPDGATLEAPLARSASRPTGRWDTCPGLRNYLVRLGWSHGDQEIFSTDEMVQAFDLQVDRAVAGPLRFRQARVSTGTTCASRPMSTSCGRWKRSCRNSGRRAPRRDVRAGPASEAPCGHAGPQGAGETLVELLDSAYYLYARRPLTSTTRRGRCWRREGRLAGMADKLEAVPMECRVGGGGRARPCRGSRREARAGGAAPSRGAHRPDDLPGLFDVMAVLGKERKPGAAEDALG